MIEFQDPEREYRRQLIADARKGQAKAQEQLRREYHVKVYSKAEREKLFYRANTKTTPSRRSHNDM